MKAYEAEQLGFNYTGMCCDEFYKAEWNEYKNRANKIKQTYAGADYRVVTERCQGRYGSTVYKHIYGNEIFCKAQYFDEANSLNIINNVIPAQMAKAKEDYERKIAELLESKRRRQEEYDYLMSIKRTK